MKVADIIVKFLEQQNVTTVFGYPGGAILPLYESLRTSSIDHVLIRNEQGATHAASGYARASETIGVAITTSGPGATNTITGIATAHMDSIPLIVITGQVRTDLIGKDAFQESDMVGATAGFTKHNYLIKKSEQVPRILAEAFYIAQTGRPGPVLIDIPRDVLDDQIEFNGFPTPNILGYKPTTDAHAGQIKRVLRCLKDSKRPIIYAGGGVNVAHAQELLKTFAETAQIPVANTMMGLGSFPMDSPLYVGMVGFHGQDTASELINQADLVLIVGARMSDRATKNYMTLNEHATVVHIDVDPAEIGKIYKHQLPIVGDLRVTLAVLNEKIEKLDTDAWLDEVQAVKPVCEKTPLEKTENVNPKRALQYLSDVLPQDTIVTADVGRNQIWAARNFCFSGTRRFFTSGGLGTMGYSLPASIGAKLARPDRTVLCVAGDGGIQMNLGELGTLSETGEKVIILLLNNFGLGMVRELQDNYDKRKHFGVDFTINPDFIKIAQAYQLDGVRITSDDQLPEALEKAYASEKSFIIECKVEELISSMI